ncbi:hypothetical protein NEOLEDRAFT_879004 [Neolentinus lepideus HHB14362 ss-1]|uniref:F-box domain-containing protein n=1 Tax=Neolentinus lepideus HHB14362 ss-1 TaxID=1314782 RepID=A0A165NZM8_9AGAM|nr:hypothetical protein NEOLEDRAFT_879004 [Neolentinus lepideus HHB14362 ss-1]
MSNTTLRRPPPSISLCLPPEIWHRVLEMVTFVPDSVYAHGLCPPRSGRPKRRDDQALRDSLVTKRRLVRVCKLWRALASRFLYETVVIGRGRTIPSLRDTLIFSKATAEGSSGGDRALGWYTRRLDLCVRGQTHIQHATPHVELEYLAEIIRCLPNLAVFIVDVTTKQYPDRMPASVMHALAETCGSSLEVLHWPDSGSRVGRVLDPKPNEWHRLLSSASNLRAIRCSDMLYSSRGYESHQGNAPVLSHLTTLTVSNKICKYYLSPSHSFPSLRHVRYHDCASCLPHAWRGLLQLYGEHITAVTLILHHFAADTQGHLDLLREFCPHLETLFLCFRSWSQFTPHLRLPPVTHLALMSVKSNSTTADCMAMFASLSTMETERVRTVQIVHERDIARLRDQKPKVLALGLAKLRTCKFDLQDYNGVILMRKDEDGDRGVLQ